MQTAKDRHLQNVEMTHLLTLGEAPYTRPGIFVFYHCYIQSLMAFSTHVTYLLVVILVKL